MQKAPEPQVVRAVEGRAKNASPRPTPVRPPTPEPIVKSKPPQATATGVNRAAGDAYLVPEYSQHNEYSFYDLNSEMAAARIVQPVADKKL